MPSVGTAYVTIRVNTKGFEAGLDKMLARLSKKMETGGKKLGDDMAKGMKSSNVEKFFRDMELRAQTASTKMRNDFKKVERSLDDVGLTASDAGDMVHDSFSKVSSTLKGVRGDLKDVSRSAKDVDRDSRAASRSLSGVGGAGRGVRAAANDMGFFSRALRNLSRQGVGVRSMLASLHDKFAIFGTAASAAVGGLSSVAQGLFAVGAQAAASAPALGIFATGLIGIAQVGGVLAIAMHGVGDAISAGFKNVTAQSAAAGGAAKGLGDGVASAARAVRDAKQGLQRAFQDAARAAEDAARRVKDAEAALAQASHATAVAQQELNAAWADGREELRQIAFAAEEASLSQQEAALDLQDAKDQLDATSDLAPDDDARVRAVLHFKEAELAYREAKDASNQADKDQAKSAKEGVKGTEAVTSAQDNLTSAQQAQAQAAQDLADARRDQARTAQDNAQAIADAQQTLADAENQLADARKKGNDATTAATTAADAYNQALKKLSPNQRAFVRRLIELGPKFKAARNDIADPLFGGLLSALNTLAGSTLWDDVVDRLTDTSTVLGDLVDDGAKAATKPPFSTALLGTMDSNNKSLKIFGRTAGNLANAFVQVADASGPVLEDFAKWTEKVTAAWSETATLNNKNGELTKTVRRAGDRVAVFKDLFVELWHWLKIVGGAATDASENFKWTNKDDPKGFIPGLTKHLKEFNDQLDKGNLRKNFTQALRNMAAAGRAVKNAVVDPLLLLGHDKRLENAFNTIGDSDAFDRLATNGGEAAEALADLVVDVADIAATLSESGSFATFIGDLDKVANVISGLLKKVPLPVLKGLGTALGFLAAIRVTTTIGKKLVSALVPPGLDKLPGRIRGAAAKATNAGIAMEEAGISVAAKFETGFAAGIKEVGVQMVRAAKAAMPKTGLIAAGSEFVAGVTVGIEEAAPAAVLATKEMALSMVRALKSTLGIKSPSVIAMEDGLQFSKGFAMGITEGAPLAEAAAAEMAVGSAGALGAGTAAAGAEGAAMSAAGGAGGIGAAGGAAGEIGKVGKFAGIFGKFSRFAGPVTKLMKPLSLGLRLVGGAFRFMLGPVGMIALTLLPILWPLLVKLEEKTGIFSKSLDVLMNVLGKVGDAFTWLWKEAIQPLFDWVKDHWPLLLAILTGPIGLAVLAIVKHFKTIKDKVTAAVHNVIKVVKKIWDGILDRWDRVQDFLNNLWPKHIKPVIDRLLKLLKDHWALFFFPIISAFIVVGRFLANLWRDKVQPKINALLESAHKKLIGFWDGIMDAWETFRRWLGTLWPSISTKIGNLVDKVSGAVGGMWDGMIDGFKTAYNSVAGLVNDKLIGGINNVLGFVHAPKITFTMKKLAEGGPVMGPGGPKSDRIPAMLSNGEYVLPARSARSIGKPALDVMRKTGRLPAGDFSVGGIFHKVIDTAKNIGGALAHGTEYAMKWVLGQFTKLIPAGLIGDIAKGAIEWAADHFTEFAASKEPVDKGSGADVTVPDPNNPQGKVSWRGVQWFTNRFLAHLQKAEQLAHTRMLIYQGGFSHSVAASGTSHYGDAIDIAVNYALLYALRRVGIAAGDRTGLGNWAPHIHAIPGPKAGYGAGSAPWQWSDYVARGGAKQAARSPWGLAKGGVVAPSDHGTLALLAEAGHHERVTPLDREGFTPAERAMLERLDASLGGGGGDTINVHPAPGMDETALADKVARRVAWNRRRGVRR